MDKRLRQVVTLVSLLLLIAVSAFRFCETWHVILRIYATDAASLHLASPCVHNKSHRTIDIAVPDNESWRLCGYDATLKMWETLDPDPQEPPREPPDAESSTASMQTTKEPTALFLGYPAHLGLHLYTSFATFVIVNMWFYNTFLRTCGFSWNAWTRLFQFALAEVLQAALAMSSRLTLLLSLIHI